MRLQDATAKFSGHQNLVLNIVTVHESNVAKMNWFSYTLITLSEFVHNISVQIRTSGMVKRFA